MFLTQYEKYEALSISECSLLLQGIHEFLKTSKEERKEDVNPGLGGNLNLILGHP